MITDKKFLEDIRKEEQDFLKAPLYLHGTEEIGTYYKKLEIEGKSVLTVNGSGDQVLNACFFGACTVTAFDIVCNTKFLLELKIAAVKELTLAEYLSFFGDEEEIGDLSYEIYSQLRDSLEQETRQFFDILFAKFDNNGKRLITSETFRKRKEFYVKIKAINPFLANTENYNKLKERIQKTKITFIEADVNNVHTKIHKKFDIINLSNVFNYISKAFDKEKISDPLAKMYKMIVDMKELLTKKGMIFYYVFYRTPEEYHTMPLIGRKESISWLKQQRDYTITEIKFEGILHGKDFIVVLTPVSP